MRLLERAEQFALNTGSWYSKHKYCCSNTDNVIPHMAQRNVSTQTISNPKPFIKAMYLPKLWSGIIHLELMFKTPLQNDFVHTVARRNSSAYAHLFLSLLDEYSLLNNHWIIHSPLGKADFKSYSKTWRKWQFRVVHLCKIYYKIQASNIPPCPVAQANTIQHTATPQPVLLKAW